MSEGATAHPMFIDSMALERHFMQQDHFAPIALERLFVQIKGVKVARNTPGVMKHLTASGIRQLLIRKTLKASFWLVRLLQVFLGGAQRLATF
ncbi:hypothetical protein EYZ11_003587 [Aspergillus tanneri]|uniref:Uncharacterized protein n=1 Tax=Aspergillus tanneri TaxID=1220188 RepID=A0A4S3JMU2_9EURO|nr:hypothetical protein EYZ11_003587 [Aspergillus tanneri]